MNKIRIISAVLTLILSASSVLSLTSCAVRRVPNDEGGNTPNGSGDTGEDNSSTDEGKTDTDKASDPTDGLTPSEGLEFEILTDEKGEDYAVLKGNGECKDRRIVIPKTYNDVPVKEIAEKAFYRKNNVMSVVIPNTVERIGNNAFWIAPLLSDVVLGNGVKYIGENAFCNLLGLKEITVPDSVTYIGNNAFSGCPNLSKVILPDNLEGIGENIVSSTAYYNDPSNWENGFLYYGKYLLASNSGEIQGICTVKDGTKIIAGYVFADNEKLEGVIFPDSVEYIGSRAFYNSRSVAYITLPKSLKIIEGGAFSVCWSVKELVIPEGVTYIGPSAFSYAGLTSVTLPNTLTCIGGGAFEHTSITEIILPDSLVTIEGQAFEGCKKLTKVVCGSSLKSIGIDAFNGCTALNDITLCSGITDFGSNIFTNTAFYNNEENWEDGALYIGEYLIKTSASGDLVVKDGTTVIAGHAIGGATSVTLPDSVKHICKGAFFRCMDLKTISMTKSVIFIGAEAFEDCTAIKDIYYSGTEEDWNKMIVEPLDNEFFIYASRHFSE